MGSSSNALVVFLRVDGAGMTGLDIGGSYVVEDGTGSAYPPGGSFGTFGVPTGFWGGAARSAPRLAAIQLQAYPRRQASFQLQLVGPRGLQGSVLRVPNLLRGPFPEWRASPMPQSRTNGPVILTLKGLAELGPKSSPRIKREWSLASSSPAWARATAKARPQIFFDPTGNEGAVLSRSEPVWKLRALVTRQDPADFAPEEQWAPTDLANPAPGEFAAVNQSAKPLGTDLKLLVLAGAGELVVSNGVAIAMNPPAAGGGSSSSVSSDAKSTIQKWSRPNPFLVVEAESLQPDDEVDFHLTDEQGREAKVLQNGYGMNGANGPNIFTVEFIPPAGARFLSVRMVVNRPLAFEFLVNSKEIRPPKP
jgi:hypothetical protein